MESCMRGKTFLYIILFGQSHKATALSFAIAHQRSSIEHWNIILFNFEFPCH